jgi:hypothetical protein
VESCRLDAPAGGQIGFAAMSKLMFAPVRLLSGLVAGMLATKLFDRIWRLVDKEQAPDPEQREIPIGKLLLGLLLQGAVFAAVRGLADHAARVAFSRATGRWPGEARPDLDQRAA